MIAGYLNLKSVTVSELETDAPLSVDADAVLACPRTFQCLQPIAGRHPQIINTSSAVQYCKALAIVLVNGGGSEKGLTTH